MPPQLVKNHVVPTSWQDEALALPGRLEGREGARRKVGFFSSLPGGCRNAGPPRLGLLLLSLTLPPAPLYLRGTQAGGGGAQTGPGDNCQLEALLGGGKRRGREKRGRALSVPPRPLRLTSCKTIEQYHNQYADIVVIH